MKQQDKSSGYSQDVDVDTAAGAKSAQSDQSEDVQRRQLKAPSRPTPTKDVEIVRDMHGMYRLTPHRAPLSRAEKEDLTDDEVRLEEDKRKKAVIEPRFYGHSFSRLQEAKDFADDEGLSVKKSVEPDGNG